MTSMVEKVARALWEAEGVAYGWNEGERRKFTWDEAVTRGLYGVDPFRIFARAAIQAMREPTQEMKSANEDVESAWGYSCHICGGPKQTYDAMIAAALKEE